MALVAVASCLPSLAQAVDTALVTVRVVDPSGEVVQRAVVSLDGLERGKTDRDGLLLLDAGARVGTTITIGVISTKGLAASAVTAHVLVAGEQRVDVTLVPEPEQAPRPTASSSAQVPEAQTPTDATLAVWVVDERGAPIPDAEVRLSRKLVGTTDAHGALVLPGLAPGRRVTLDVAAPHRVPVSVGSVELALGRQGRTVALQASDTDLDGVVDLEDACIEEGETLNGYRDDDGCPDQLAVLSVLVVDPDGYPVPGALVRVGTGEALSTDETGRVLVTGLMPGIRVPLRAEAAGSDPGGIGALDLLPGTQSITVKLQRTREDWGSDPVLEVEVVDPAGSPVAGASIRVDGQFKGVTDQRGRFVHSGRRMGSTLVVAIAAPDADRLSTAIQAVTLEGGRQVLKVRLDGADLGLGAISTDDPDSDGVIATFDDCPAEPETANGYRDEDGCPDALATVQVRVVDPVGEPVAGAELRTVRGLVAVVDRDGRARVTDLVPETSLTWEVRAPRPGYRNAVLRVDRLEQGLQEASVELPWRDADLDGVPDLTDACPDEAEVKNAFADDDGCPDKLASVLLTVLQASGAPAAGASVSLDGTLQGTTDGDGDLKVVDLVPGRTATFVVGETSVRVELVEGAQREKLVLPR